MVPKIGQHTQIGVIKRGGGERDKKVDSKIQGKLSAQEIAEEMIQASIERINGRNGVSSSSKSVKGVAPSINAQLTTPSHPNFLSPSQGTSPSPTRISKTLGAPSPPPLNPLLVPPLPPAPSLPDKLWTASTVSSPRHSRDPVVELTTYYNRKINELTSERDSLKSKNSSLIHSNETLRIKFEEEWKKRKELEEELEGLKKKKFKFTFEAKIEDAE